MTTDDEAALLKDYATVFASEAGERVLVDIQRRSFTGQTTLAAPTASQPIDPLRTMFNEGKRTAALEIHARVLRGRRLGRTDTQTHAITATTPED